MFEDLLQSRKLFFGALLAVAVVDLIDRWIKLQLELSVPPPIPYAFLMSLWITLSVIAMSVRNRVYHSVFPVMFLTAITVWQGYANSGVLDVVAKSA